MDWIGVRGVELAQNLLQRRTLVLVFWKFRNVLPESCFIRMFKEIPPAERALFSTTFLSLVLIPRRITISATSKING